MKAFGIVGAVMAVSLGIASACTGPEVVLATLPNAEDAAAPIRCAGDPDCPGGTYCEKSACDAATGTCALVPATCTNAEQPVCGCDGVTYFNDCLRQANAVASSTPLPCLLELALICGGKSGETCPAGSTCAQLERGGPQPCPMDAVGICWTMPSECPAPDPNSMRWAACTPARRCVDTCTAILSGGVYQHMMSCP